MRKIFNTPLKIALAVTPLNVAISIVLEWLFTRLVTWTTVLIAAPLTFIMVYLVTSTMLRYQHLLNQKNQQLKKATKELRETNTIISKQNIELDAFSQTIAHELKTPLGVIIGYSHLLAKEGFSSNPENIETISKQITQTSLKMNTIIQDMLLLASLRQADNVQIYSLDMDHIVSETLERLDHLVLKTRAQIITPKTWPEVSGYGPWIEEVWSNYISNALKYGGHTPKIELGTDDKHRSGQVRFWVRDYGRGMTLEQQARAFTQFTRFSPDNIQGHGLGLSISQRIIEKLGGEVGVESRLLYGSTFYFTLPSV